MPTDPLKFSREPAPRHAYDYKAVRNGITYLIWHARDHGGTFGLSICDLVPHTPAADRWRKINRLDGIIWLRTKRRCEEVANEIAELVEKDQRAARKALGAAA